MNRFIAALLSGIPTYIMIGLLDAGMADAHLQAAAVQRAQHVSAIAAHVEQAPPVALPRVVVEGKHVD